MKKSRLSSFILIIVTIGLGLLSRTSFVPELIYPYLGDVLYSVMMFFLIRFFYNNLSSKQIALISTLICFGIEFLQLYQADWINEIRSTTLGSLTLGHGFLWSDLLAYSIGGFLGLGLERFIYKKES